MLTSAPIAREFDLGVIPLDQQLMPHIVCPDYGGRRLFLIASSAI
jgi:hypothetical protein